MTRAGQWLRELDGDVLSGRLLQRCVVVAPMLVAAGLVLGAAIGLALVVLAALVLPTEAVVAGPDGSPRVVPYDRSVLVVLGPLVGSLVGGGAGAVLAARRCRALRSRTTAGRTHG